MSRVFASLAVLLAAAVAVSAAPVPAAAPANRTTLSIRWHGQSFFEITTTKGTNIVLDPHAIEEYPRVEVKADLILMSHLHDDHTQTFVVSNVKDLTEKGMVINALKKNGDKQDFDSIKEFKPIKDVKIRNVQVYHDDSQGMKRGKNGVWIIEADGLKIVHLGDLGHQLTDAQIKAIGEVDVLLIPVGGIYTINGIDAQKVVKQLKPRRYVIPMHYGTKVYDSVLPISSFIDDLPNDEFGFKKELGNELLIDPTEKPREKPVIVQLDYKPA
jgi:L-ascorbate metabolism protein UlaG (beta-lactamase superfamily)